jgi:geranylgeranylglycerol-phosphate geranylgeranyltransferase
MVVVGVMTSRAGIMLGAASREAALAAGALALALGGAFALNDVFDRKSDAVNVRTRPIPSGAISVRSAVLIGGCCSFTGLILAYATMNGGIVAVVAFLTVLLLAYSWRLKPIPVLKNVIMASVGISIPLVAAIAARNFGDPRIWWLAALIGLFTFQKEITADVYDLKGDIEVRLRTLPILLGVGRAMLIVCGVNVALALTALAWMAFGSGSAVLLTSVAVIAAVNAIGALVVRSRPSVVNLFLFGQKTIQLCGIAVASAL